MTKSAYWEAQLVAFVEDTDPEAKKIKVTRTSILDVNGKTIAKYSISVSFKSRIEDKTFNWDKDFYFDVSKAFSQ